MTPIITMSAKNVLKGRVIESESDSGAVGVGVKVFVGVAGEVGFTESDVWGIFTVCVLLHPLD